MPHYVSIESDNEGVHAYFSAKKGVYSQGFLIQLNPIDLWGINKKITILQV
jgi:hypothetical protein